jgi:methionine biosynthesis protein MetW
MIDPAVEIRPDLQIVADWIAPGTRVLDIGCGYGALLAYLAREKGVDGRGIEIRRSKVNSCVAMGLPVIRGDANTDLSLYPTGSFDYVLLTQTLQNVDDPKHVLEELIRIGSRAIVSIPNFGHWRIRLSLLLNGRMPMTEALDEPWYESKNTHFCTIRDFLALADDMGLTIEQYAVLNSKGRQSNARVTSRCANILGEQAVFMLRHG